MTIFVGHRISMHSSLIKYFFLVLAQLLLITHDLFSHQHDGHLVIWQDKYTVLPSNSAEHSDSNNHIPFKAQHEHCCNLDATELLLPRFFSLLTIIESNRYQITMMPKWVSEGSNRVVIIKPEAQNGLALFYTIPMQKCIGLGGFLFNRPPPAYC